MSQPTSENEPSMNVLDVMRRRAEDIARRWRERNPEVQPPIRQEALRTAQEVVEERSRDYLQAQREMMQAVQAQATAQSELNQAARNAMATASLNRELAAQAELEKLDIRLDPDVNRIAELFFTSLTQRIYLEFGHSNPDWLSLGAREKRLWLEAADIVLDELAREPVANKELAAIVNKRIIQG